MGAVLSRCCRGPALAGTASDATAEASRLETTDEALQTAALAAQRPAVTGSGGTAVKPRNVERSPDDSASVRPPPPHPQPCLTHEQHATQAAPSGSANVQQPRESPAGRSTSPTAELGSTAGPSSPLPQQTDPRVTPSEGAGGGGGGGSLPGIEAPSPGRHAPLLRRAPGHVTLPVPLAFGPAACTRVAADDVGVDNLHRSASSGATAPGSAAGPWAASAHTASAAGSTLQLPPSPGPTTPPSKTAASRPAPVTPAPTHPLHPSPQHHHTHSWHHAHAHASEVLTLRSSGIPSVPHAGPSAPARPDAAASPSGPYGGSQLQQQPGQPAQASARLDLQASSGVSTLCWSSTVHSGSIGAERAALPAAGSGARAGRAATGPAPQTSVATATASVAPPLPLVTQLQHQQQEAAAPVEASLAHGWLPCASGGAPAAHEQPQRRSSRQLQPQQDQGTTGLLPVSHISHEVNTSDVEDGEGHYGRSVTGRDSGGQGSDAGESAVNSDIEHDSDGGGVAAVAAAAGGRGGRAGGWSVQTAPADINQQAAARVGGDVQQQDKQQQQQRERPWQPPAAVSSGAGLLRSNTLMQVQAEAVGHTEGSAASGSAVLGSSSAAGRSPEQRTTGLGLLGPDPVGAAAGMLWRPEFTFGSPHAKWRRASAAVTRSPLHHIVAPSATTGSSTSSVGAHRHSTAAAAAMSQSEAAGTPLPPRAAVGAASAPSCSSPPSASTLDATQAALLPSCGGEHAQAAPAYLVPSASRAVYVESPPRLPAEQQQQQVPALPLQQRQPSPPGASEPTTPFGAAAATHYYQSLVRQDVRGTGRPGCMVAPLSLPPPPGLVLPLALPPGGHSSASESSSSGRSPVHQGPGAAGRHHARPGSTGATVSPAHPFRLTLLPCEPGSEVDNLLALAANISQAPVVLAAALLPGTFFVKLNRSMIAAAIAAGRCPDASAAVSTQLPSAASLSIPAASSQTSHFVASHPGSAAAAMTRATGEPVAARAAGQSMTAAVAGARTVAQVVGDEEWQLGLAGWAVSASLEAAAGRPQGSGSNARGHGGRARAAEHGGMDSGGGAEAEAELEAGDSGEWAEVKGGCDLTMVIVEDASVDARTREEAFARMAPPIRFVLAVPLETADAAEATGSVGSSGGRPTEAAGVKGPAHAPGTAPMPRLLGALCLADFKPRAAASICHPLLDNVRRLLLSHLGRDVQMYDEQQKAKAVLAELVGSLQRLLDRYDTAVLLANLPPAGPAGGHTPGSCAGGDAGAGAGPAGGQEADVGREPRWPVLYVNNAWTALTGLQRDDVLGQDLRDLITTAVAQSPPQPSTAALPPPTASGASSQAGAGGSAHDGAQGLGPGPTTHHLLAVSPRPAPVAAAVPTPASAALRYAPIPWEQHQVLAAAREDVVLHNVVLPAAAAAGAGPGSTGGGFAPRGPLATLHFRFVAREIHEESGLLPAGWQSLLGTIREDGWRAFGLVTPEPAQPPSRPWSALGSPDETTEGVSYAAALSQHCTSKVPGLELSRLLGKGGFGSVYCGTWHGAAVAVKMIDVSGNRLSVECASLEAVLGQALDHPHLVKTLMYLARGGDGPMVQFGGDGGGLELPDSTASSSSTIVNFLRQVRSAGRAGGGRGHRPAGQALSLPTASLAAGSVGSASGRSRLSLPGRPAVGQGSAGLGWPGGSMGEEAAAQWRAGFTGDPRGEGTAGRGQAAELRTATSMESGIECRRLTPRSGSSHRSSSSVRLSAGQARGNVSSAGSGGGDGSTGGGAWDSLHALSHASFRASLALLGMGMASISNSTNRSVPGGGAVAASAGFLPAGRGGTPLEVVPESASSTSDDTSLIGTPKAQQQNAEAAGAAGITAGQEALIASPFCSEHLFERRAAGTASATHHAHAQDPFTVFSAAMLTGLHQQQLGRATTGVSDAASAERGTHVLLTSASRLGVARLGVGGINMWSTSDSSTVRGSGGGGGSGPGGSAGQLSMTSSQVAAAVRLTSASGVWRQRQGSGATSGTAALPYGGLSGSGSSTWRSGMGSGAGPATPGSEEAGTALLATGGSRTGGRQVMAGATGKFTPGPPTQRQQWQQQQQQVSASVSGSQGRTSTSPFGPPPPVTPAHPAGPPSGLRAGVPDPPANRVARVRAPACGAPDPAIEDPAAAPDPEAAAAMEAHRQALQLLNAGASSGTATGTPNTSASAPLSSSSPQPRLSSSSSAHQPRHRSHQQHAQPLPLRSPQQRPLLQHGMAAAEEAAGASRAPGGTASLSAFAATSQRRRSSGPLTGPGLAPTGGAVAGTAPNTAGTALATAASAPTASTDAAPVGFPSTAAEASAVRHGGTEDIAPQPHSYPAGGGSGVPCEVAGQEHRPAERQREEEEEEEGPTGMGSGSFSDIDSGSELMGTDILDSPRTAARAAREARKVAQAKSAAAAMAPATDDPAVGSALGALGHPGGVRAGAGFGAAGQGPMAMGGAGCAAATTAGAVSEVWIVMEYCDLDTLQLALERGLFALPPGPSLASFSSLASSGSPSHPVACMSHFGTTGGGGPTGRPAHGPAARRVDMRALVATALEVASALRYLHDLGIVHGDLTARNVMLVSLERAHGRPHAPGVSLPSSSPRIPSHSQSHVPTPGTGQPSGEAGGTTPRSSTSGGAGGPRGPAVHRHADAFGPRHVCRVRPSAVIPRMHSPATSHASSTSTSNAASTASGGRSAGSGSGRVPAAARPASVDLSAGSAAAPRAGMLPGRDATPEERPPPGVGVGSGRAAGPQPGAMCSACGRCFVAKVADFGLSRTLDMQSKILTKTVGTITSMPPETLLSGAVSKAADVYAYGVLLWQMYTGLRPWSGMNHGQVVYNVGMKGQQLPFPPDTPHGLMALSRACTRSAARDRPTFARLQHQLAQLATEQGLPLE